MHLNLRNQTTAIKVISAVEQLLDQGELAGKLILENNPNLQTCEDILPELRELATTLPYVRSVNLGQGDKVICSSFAGSVNVLLNSSGYTHGKLELLSSSLVQSQHPALVVKSSGHHNGDIDVLSVIDGVYISNVLSQQADDDLAIYFNVGSEWLSQEGGMSWATPENYRAGEQILRSQTYPFSVFVAVKSSSLIMTFVREKWLSVLIIEIMFSVLFWTALKSLNRPYSLRADMERGLRENEFVPYAQTIVDAQNGHIFGIEILMRWEHPTQGLVRPDIFIPLAEDTGLIVPMTRTLLKKTAQCLHHYKAQLPDSLHVGINIAAPHCKDPRLLQDCRDFIAVAGSQRVHLTLELTERYPVEVNAETIALFKQLQDSGVVLAIDDFGTGHSSLSYFKDFRISYIKIDKSFVSQTGNDAVSEHLIDNIIDLGKRLEVNIIAEGVENENQVKKLQAMQVNYLQGYLYSKPLPLDVVLASFAEHRE
ncbi:EAL domain-containing protein [Kluyvera intermedia]|uniref:EAL domain-containing protein n=1 Tax=Kluyvera intermedia TaxID=61648 RepID=UPI003523F8B2